MAQTKPEPELPPPMPQYAANNQAAPTPAHEPIYPQPPAVSAGRAPEPADGYPVGSHVMPEPERKRNYLLAFLNPRTYALLMYFLFWSFPLGVIGAYWVNFSFWFSVAFMPLCCVGVAFIIVFSWTWRALCALEVFIINCICPPSSGPIERQPLRFTPHLKDPLTWFSVPYWCFFKVIWSSLVFGILVAFYWGTIICLLSPFFFFLDIGMECKTCTGVWVIFVHVPVGIFGFWFTTTLTMLLGSAEAEIIKLLNHKRAAQYTLVEKYTEQTPLVVESQYNGERQTWVIPNTTLVAIAKKGSNGSRLCAGIGCCCCLAVTILMAFIGLTGIASLHCTEWDSSERVTSTLASGEMRVSDYPSFGVDMSGWSQGAGFWDIDNSGSIDIVMDSRYTDTILYQLEATAAPNHNIHVDNHTVTSSIDPDTGLLNVGGNFISAVKQLSSCAEIKVTITVPRSPTWTNLPIFKIRGANDMPVTISYSNDFADSLSGVDIQIRNSGITLHLQDDYDPNSNYEPRGTWWNVKTTNGGIQVYDFLALGNATFSTTNYFISFAGTVVTQSLTIDGSQTSISISKLNMSAPTMPQYVTISGDHGWSDQELDDIYFNPNVSFLQPKGISLKGNHEWDFTTHGYFGRFDLQTHDDWNGVNIYKNAYPYDDYEWDMLIGNSKHMKGYVVPASNPSMTTSNYITAETSYSGIYWSYDKFCEDVTRC